MSEGMYTSGEYSKHNPSWHVEDSPWKARQVIKMLQRNNLLPKTVCEVGCGTGEILIQLQQNMPNDCDFYGYEISPQAFELCNKKTNNKLHFKLTDFLKEKMVSYDIILLIDLIEHLEDYFTFMREIKNKSNYKIIHIPLDITVSYALRHTVLSNSRRSLGHLHYFTKDLALQMLEELNYEVLDYFLTCGAMELPAKSTRRYIAKLPRKLLFVINEWFAARIMGGYSLMILAR